MSLGKGKVIRYESLEYHIRKCQLDIKNFNTGHKHDINPNFRQFRVTNKTLKDSDVRSYC